MALIEPSPNPAAGRAHRDGCNLYRSNATAREIATSINTYRQSGDLEVRPLM